MKKNRHNRAVYTIQEVAGLMGCTTVHVINLIDSGALAAVNIGTGAARVWRVEISEFDRFKASQGGVNAGGAK